MQKRHDENEVHVRLTVHGYVVHWEVVHVSHVAERREDHKAGQDACKRVDGRHN